MWRWSNKGLGNNISRLYRRVYLRLGCVKSVILGDRHFGFRDSKKNLLLKSTLSFFDGIGVSRNTIGIGLSLIDVLSVISIVLLSHLPVSVSVSHYHCNTCTKQTTFYVSIWANILLPNSRCWVLDQSFWLIIVKSCLFHLLFLWHLLLLYIHYKCS